MRMATAPGVQTSPHHGLTCFNLLQPASTCFNLHQPQDKEMQSLCPSYIRYNDYESWMECWWFIACFLTNMSGAPTSATNAASATLQKGISRAKQLVFHRVSSLEKFTQGLLEPEEGLFWCHATNLKHEISPHIPQCPGASVVIVAISGALNAKFQLFMSGEYPKRFQIACVKICFVGCSPIIHKSLRWANCWYTNLLVQGDAFLQSEIDGECTLSPRPKGWLLLQQHLDDGFSCGLAAKTWRTRVERASCLWAAKVVYTYNWLSLFSCQSTSLWYVHW